MRVFLYEAKVRNEKMKVEVDYSPNFGDEWPCIWKAEDGKSFRAYAKNWEVPETLANLRSSEGSLLSEKEKEWVEKTMKWLKDNMIQNGSKKGWYADLKEKKNAK